MQSNLKKTENKTTFPALYQDTDSNTVILFTDLTTGTVVIQSNSLHPYSLGYHTNDWPPCTNDEWKRLNHGDSVELIQD